MIADTIPDLPTNERWTEPDGCEYGTEKVMLALGFTPPLLRAARDQARPELDGRKIRHFDKVFYRTRRDGFRRKIRTDLYSLDDGKEFLAARGKPLKMTGEKQKTATEVAKDLNVAVGTVYWHLREKRISAGKETKLERFHLRGRSQRRIKQRMSRIRDKITIPKSQAAALSVAADPTRISLADAKRATGLQDATWTGWERFCIFLEKKLKIVKQDWPCAGKLSWPQLTISREDFDIIVCGLDEARQGRFLRDGAAYLSTPNVVRDFEVLNRSNQRWEKTDPTLRLLSRKIKTDGIGKLGQEPDSRRGYYLNAAGGLSACAYWSETDLERMYNRTRPAPPPPIQERQSNSGDETTKPSPQPTGKYIVDVASEYARRGCVQVAGQIVEVSNGTWKLLHVLAVARAEGRAEGRGASRSEIEQVTDIGSARKTLKAFEERYGEGQPLIDWAGVKSKLGYRLR